MSDYIAPDVYLNTYASRAYGMPGVNDYAGNANVVIFVEDTSDNGGAAHHTMTPGAARKLAYDLLEAADAAAMAEATGFPFTDTRRINSLNRYFRAPIGG